MDQIRVFLVDDHAIVRDALAAIIGESPDFLVVGQAGSGAEALQAVPNSKFDVMVLDQELPDISGEEVARVALEGDPECNILMLTTHREIEIVKRCLAAGVRGYLLKTCPTLEVLDGLRSVAAGNDVIDTSMALSLAASYGKPTLSDREVEVLKLVSNGKSNKEIAEILFIAEGTIKGHLHKITTKLKASSRAEAVTIAIRLGYFRI